MTQGLNMRQKLFVRLYLANGGNATQAAREAGYQNPNMHAARLMKNPLIQQAATAHIDKTMKKTEVTKEWLIEQYRKWAQASETLSKYKKVDKHGSLYWDFTHATQEDLALITGLATETYVDGRGKHKRAVKRFKIETVDPKAAVDQLGRVLGIFNDKIQVGGELSLIERLQKGRERSKRGE